MTFANDGHQHVVLDTSFGKTYRWTHFWSSVCLSVINSTIIASTAQRVANKASPWWNVSSLSVLCEYMSTPRVVL